VTITSPHNERLKEIRKLARRRAREQSGRFVAEGEDLLAAAEHAGWPALERYSAAGSGLPGVAVEPELLAAASQLGSGTRALAVYEQRWAPAPLGPLCVALHGIADPGNVGAVLRSALAFGAASVALGPGCADPYGPKAVRASMGALFAVPLARFASVDELPGATIALDAHAGEPLRGPAGEEATILVGAERAGLPAELLDACDRVARISIRSESLNAAMAATVALYELTRADHRMGAA
jgi:TrmH family RNA methyltransferase